MKIIIVAGVQRSGTTLVGQILGVHSRSFLIDESDDVFHPFCHWLLNDSQATFPERTLSQAAKKYNDERSTVRKKWHLDEYNLVIKAPNMTFEYERLSKLNIQHRIIIFPVRDPRSVVAAMLRRKKSNMIEKQTNWFIKHPFFLQNHQEVLLSLVNQNTPAHIKAALIWVQKTNLYKNFQSHLINPLIIRYEDMVCKVEESCIKLVNHCDLSYESSLKKHHMILSGKGPGNTVRDRQIDKNSLNKWQTELSKQQVNQINQICGATMHELGYEL